LELLLNRFVIDPTKTFESPFCAPLGSAPVFILRYHLVLYRALKSSVSLSFVEIKQHSLSCYCSITLTWITTRVLINLYVWLPKWITYYLRHSTVFRWAVMGRTDHRFKGILTTNLNQNELTLRQSHDRVQTLGKAVIGFDLPSASIWPVPSVVGAVGALFSNTGYVHSRMYEKLPCQQ